MCNAHAHQLPGAATDPPSDRHRGSPGHFRIGETRGGVRGGGFEQGADEQANPRGVFFMWLKSFDIGERYLKAQKKISRPVKLVFVWYPSSVRAERPGFRFWFHSPRGGMGIVFFDAGGLISRVSAKHFLGVFAAFFGVFMLLFCFVLFVCLPATLPKRVVVSSKYKHQLPKTKQENWQAQDRSPKCRGPSPLALGGGRGADKSRRRVGFWHQTRRDCSRRAWQ